MFTPIAVKEYVKKEKEKILSKKALCFDGVNPPSLCVVQVGDNPASNSYISGKKKDCDELGFCFEHVKLSDDVNQNILVRVIKDVSLSYDGVVLQLPIPDNLSKCSAFEAIERTCDVDGLKKSSLFTPCTPLGIISYLTICNYDFSGKNALVIGRSDLVGKPLTNLLIDKRANVTCVNSTFGSESLKCVVANSDIVFTAIDKIELFDSNLFEGFNGVVIDIGLGRGSDGKLHGNLTKEAVKSLEENNSFVISGIGGVGLLTRIGLMNNVLYAASLHR